MKVKRLSNRLKGGGSAATFAMTQNNSSSSSTEPFSDREDQTLSVAPSWAQQDDALRLLWLENKPPEEIAETLHRSVAAVMTRAARLGLPRRAAPGRKKGYKRTDPPRRRFVQKNKMRQASVYVPKEKREEPSQVSMRVCLMCLSKFQSLGRFNRICPACKGSAEYATGSSTPDFTFTVSGS